jgi:hypothetical protein
MLLTRSSIEVSRPLTTLLNKTIQVINHVFYIEYKKPQNIYAN